MPARALGLDVAAAEAVLREGRTMHGGNGTTAGAGHAARAEEHAAARAALTNLAQAAGLKARGVRDLIPDPAQRRGAEAFAPPAPVESARARLGEAWHRILRG